MIKRFFNYIINSICMCILVCLFAIFIYWYIFSLFNFKYYDPNYMFLPLVIIILVLAMPLCGYYILFEVGSINQVMSIVYIVSSVIISAVIIETIITFIFKGDLGNLIFKIRVYREDNKKPTLLKILFRTTIKYLSIAFFLPILLFPLFNKRRLFLHEIISGVYKCDKDDIIPPKNNNNDEDEGEYSPYFMG